MKAKQLRKKLDYLPRWAWYALSFFIAGPFGPFVVYLVFHVLGKMEQEQAEEERGSFRASRAYGSTEAYEDEDCVVSSDEEINRQWQKTQSSAAQARTQKAAQQKAAQPMDEDAGVEEVIRSGYDALRRIRQANDIIADEALSAHIDSIESSCGQILSILEQRPQLLPQLRTFLRYYLPATLGLLQERAKLEGEVGANAPIAAKIREAMAQVQAAFHKQLDALNEFRFINLESEMDVLSEMLASDGLLEREQKAAPTQAADDPLAGLFGQGGRG